MSNGGRTMWRAKDCGWWTREWIVTLGEEFGADGPAVIDWLEDQARLQNDGGHVKAGPRAVARGCFVDPVTVGHVLSRAVTLGLVEDYVESKGRFECVIAWFRPDQGKAGATFRKANQRARESTDTGDSRSAVTVGHDESPAVTKSHINKTRQENNNSSRPTKSDEAQIEKAKATEDDRRLCRLLAEMIKAHNPKAKVGSDWRWLQSMRRLRELDGNDPTEIESLIRWMFAAQSEDAAFWASTVQSASGLRSHFAQVWARMQDAERKGQQLKVVESSADYLARRGAA